LKNDTWTFHFITCTIGTLAKDIIVTRDYDWLVKIGLSN